LLRDLVVKITSWAGQKFFGQFLGQPKIHPPSISANAAMDEDTEVIDEKRNAEEGDDVDANNTPGGNPTNLTVDSSLLDSSLSEPRRIKKLDPTVVNRIAAGTQQT
jgi:hypothetical protein